MDRFSERIGIVPVRTVLQLDSMDNLLRNGLWNALTISYWNTLRPSASDMYHRLLLSSNDQHAALCNALWLDFFKEPLDSLGNDFAKVHAVLKEWFLEAEWYAIYDLVEFVANAFPDDRVNDRFRAYCNKVLERENAAYRFAGDKSARITSDVEIAAIDEAQGSEMNTVAHHMRRALALLADRSGPDYRNSIKESISAVEALVRRYAGGDKTRP